MKTSNHLQRTEFSCTHKKKIVDQFSSWVSFFLIISFIDVHTKWTQHKLCTHLPISPSSFVCHKFYCCVCALYLCIFNVHVIPIQFPFHFSFHSIVFRRSQLVQQLKTVWVCVYTTNSSHVAAFFPLILTNKQTCTYTRRKRSLKKRDTFKIWPF